MTDNYRGINLTRIVAKMFKRMILNRLRPAIDPLLRNSQNGFREDRSTTSQLLARKRIIEEVKLNNLSAVITFIDFQKALDSIHGGKMINTRGLWSSSAFVKGHQLDEQQDESQGDHSR